MNRTPRPPWQSRLGSVLVHVWFSYHQPRRFGLRATMLQNVDLASCLRLVELTWRTSLTSCRPSTPSPTIARPLCSPVRVVSAFRRPQIGHALSSPCRPLRSGRLLSCWARRLCRNHPSSRPARQILCTRARVKPPTAAARHLSRTCRTRWPT